MQAHTTSHDGSFESDFEISSDSKSLVDAVCTNNSQAIVNILCTKEDGKNAVMNFNGKKVEAECKNIVSDKSTTFKVPEDNKKLTTVTYSKQYLELTSVAPV